MEIEFNSSRMFRGDLRALIAAGLNFICGFNDLQWPVSFTLYGVQDGLRLYSAHKCPSSCCIPGPPSCLRSLRFLSLVAPFCGFFCRCVKPQFLSHCCRHLFVVRNLRTTHSSTFDRVSALHSLTAPRDGLLSCWHVKY